MSLRRISPKATRNALLNRSLEAFQAQESRLRQALEDPSFGDIPRIVIEEAFWRLRFLNLIPEFHKDLKRVQKLHQGLMKAPAEQTQTALEQFHQEEKQVADKWGLSRLPGEAVTGMAEFFEPSALSIVMTSYLPVQITQVREGRFLWLLIDLEYKDELILSEVKAKVDQIKASVKQPSSRRHIKKFENQYKVYVLKADGLRDAEIAKLLWLDEYERERQRYPIRNKVLQRVSDSYRAAKRTLEKLKKEGRGREKAKAQRKP